MINKIRTWCVPSAVFCATAWGIKSGMPVRIAITKIDASTDHAQAETQTESGEWIPLTEIDDGECMAVIPYRRHYPEIEPYRYWTLGEFVEEQIRVNGVR